MTDDRRRLPPIERKRIPASPPVAQDGTAPDLTWLSGYAKFLGEQIDCYQRMYLASLKMSSVFIAATGVWLAGAFVLSLMVGPPATLIVSMAACATAIVTQEALRAERRARQEISPPDISPDGESEDDRCPL